MDSLAHMLLNFHPDLQLPFQHHEIFFFKVGPFYHVQSIICLIAHTYFIVCVCFPFEYCG